MKRIAIILLGLGLMLPAAPAKADHPAGATPRDIRLLQDDLENLDDVVSQLDSADSRTSEFRRREQRIQDEVVALRDEMQRHRRNSTVGYGASKQAVDDLRQDIQTLQSDIDRAYAGRYSGDYTLGEGTRLQLRLEGPLSSKTARIEDTVEASVDYPVRDSSGRMAIPAGSRVVGRVVDVQKANRPLHSGKLDIAFDTLYIGNTRHDVRGRVVSLDEDVDRSSTAGRAGIGAVLGGVLGGILGGTKGAVAGAVIGGAGGVVSASGDDVELPAGTIMTVQLDRPVTARRF
jgi:hypothetical protein